MSPRLPLLLTLMAAIALIAFLPRGEPGSSAKEGGSRPRIETPTLAGSPTGTVPAVAVSSAPSAESLELRIGRLIREGRFADALALAQKLPSAPVGPRRDCLAAVFAAWARTVPAEAPALVEILRNEEPDTIVFRAFARGWAESAPAALADHALTLAAGENRSAALAAAMERWILVAPAEAAGWIPRLSDPVEFDQAASLLVERTDTLHRPTATALSLAENLSDPALRLRSLSHVIREWAGQDPAAARHFAETSPTLSPEQRAALLAVLTPPVIET